MRDNSHHKIFTEFIVLELVAFCLCDILGSDPGIRFLLAPQLLEGFWFLLYILLLLRSTMGRLTNTGFFMVPSVFLLFIHSQ